jgi:hypothetical protein
VRGKKTPARKPKTRLRCTRTHEARFYRFPEKLE